MARPTPPRELHVELLSDATFADDAPLAGPTDVEVQHDELGLPAIGGQILRALLRDAWRPMARHFPQLYPAAERVLGAGSELGEALRLRIGDARVSPAIRAAVRRRGREPEPPTPAAILETFTAIRPSAFGARGAEIAAAPRRSRVVLRGFRFAAPLQWLEGYAPGWDDLRALALAALAVRHGGELHHRGRGHLRLTLDGDLAQTRRHALDKR